MSLTVDSIIWSSEVNGSDCFQRAADLKIRRKESNRLFYFKADKHVGWGSELDHQSVPFDPQNSWKLMTRTVFLDFVSFHCDL